MQINQVNVQRWSITSRKPFDTVLAAVEEAIGRPSMVEFAAKVAAATTFEEMQNVINESEARSASWSSCGSITARYLPKPE